MTTSAAPSTSTKGDRHHAEPTDDGKTAGHAAAGHGRGPENAGTRSSDQRAEFPRTTRAAGRSTMELAREPGAGAKTESGQTARTGLCGGHRLSHSAWPGQDGSACSSKRLGLGPQPRKHFCVGSDRRGQELHRIGPGTESLSRRLLGSLFAGRRLTARTGPGTGRWKLAPLLGSTGPYRRCRVSLLSAVAELILKDFHA